MHPITMRRERGGNFAVDYDSRLIVSEEVKEGRGGGRGGGGGGSQEVNVP